jgi:hypothetical protein
MAVPAPLQAELLARPACPHPPAAILGPCGKGRRHGPPRKGRDATLLPCGLTEMFGPGPLPAAVGVTTVAALRLDRGR